jgi:predicted acetyltransferase
MNSKDFPVLMRAIIKILNRQERRYNCNIIRELEIFSSLVKTAQYYDRDIYWI